MKQIDIFWNYTALYDYMPNSMVYCYGSLTRLEGFTAYNPCMPTIAHIRALGEEIHRQRLAKGIRSKRKLAEITGLSAQHVGQIENAYVNPKRGFFVPSDEVLEKLAVALDIPISRLHSLLGRFPDIPYPALSDPEAMEVAEAYSRHPHYCRVIVQDALRIAQNVVVIVEQNAPKHDGAE